MGTPRWNPKLRGGDIASGCYLRIWRDSCGKFSSFNGNSFPWPRFFFGAGDPRPSRYLESDTQEFLFVARRSSSALKWGSYFWRPPAQIFGNHPPCEVVPGPFFRHSIRISRCSGEFSMEKKGNCLKLKGRSQQIELLFKCMTFFSLKSKICFKMHHRK